MSGMYYNNPYVNPFAAQNLQQMPMQYGVDTSSEALSAAGGVASMIPVVGPLLGAGLNMASQAMQNAKQEEFYSKYMSPQARMAQMRAAGINPNAAAQGISGSSAPQMNAASPTGAFSSLGEALGNSVNTALTAGNIAAQTHNLEVQTEGQDLMNKMTEVELGIKPSMVAAQLDDLKASAQQKYQAVAQSKEEVKKIGEEIEKLKKEQGLIEAQEGAIEYDNKLKEAETRLAAAKKALTDSEKQLTDVNRQIQEKERDNYLTPAERIEKEAKETAKAPVTETPQGKIAQMYIDEMNKDLEWIDKLIKDKASVFGPNHSEVRKLKNQRDGIIRSYRNKIRRINKGFAAGANFAGYGLNAGG